MSHCYLCGAFISGREHRRRVDTGDSRRTYIGRRGISVSYGHNEGLRTVCGGCAARIDKRREAAARIWTCLGVVILIGAGIGQIGSRLAPTTAGPTAVTMTPSRAGPPSAAAALTPALAQASRTFAAAPAAPSPRPSATAVALATDELQARSVLAGASPAAVPTPAPAASPSPDPTASECITAAIAVHVLRGSLRDPDSLVLERVYSRRPAKAVCIAYRAKNGFGGVDRESVAFYNLALTKNSKFWNQHCAGAGFYDVALWNLSTCESLLESRLAR